MDLVVLATQAAADGTLIAWMESAFYPVLFAIFVIASLGVPIPEDVPLILAGVLLHSHPEIGTFQGTFLVSLLGIMSGDLILYSFGRIWGREVYQHRWVKWIITPARLEKMTAHFHRYGAWFVFFGRFIVGIRAVMCVSAGVTRFPYWRFFLADLAGAMITVSLFVQLGYFFADRFPLLRTYLEGLQWGVLAFVVLMVVGFVGYKLWTNRKRPVEQEPVSDEALPQPMREEAGTDPQPPAPSAAADAVDAPRQPDEKRPTTGTRPRRISAKVVPTKRQTAT